MKRIVVAFVLFGCALAFADEGMWTLDDFPFQLVEQRHGVSVSRETIREAMLSSVRLAQGCSGSFVSPDGLVMTNHHCVSSCLAQISGGGDDFLKTGFYANEAKEERRCANFEIDELIEIKDVTARVKEATKGLSGADFGKKKREEIARIEKECSTANDVRCEVVTLYHGAKYNLYRYKRFEDVRLVFAPESDVAFFGGDPDNFMFPRFDLDFAFLRVYQGGKPLKTKHYFSVRTKPVRDGEVLFVTGHPGRTQRLYTKSQVEFLRDRLYPLFIWMLGEMRQLLLCLLQKSDEAERPLCQNDLFFVENSLKAYRGMHQTFAERRFMDFKEEWERQVLGSAEDKEKVRKAFEDIFVSQRVLSDILEEYLLLEGRFSMLSKVLVWARHIVRWNEEKKKPNEERLSEYTDAELPSLRQEIFADIPAGRQLEEAKIAFYLSKIREVLGSEHEVTKRVLEGKTPEEVARELVEGTGIFDAQVRKKMFEEGIEGTKDPAIELVLRLDGAARAVRKRYEDEVEARVNIGQDTIMASFFKNTKVYPDATFTLRITFGKVAGYKEKGRWVAPFTNIKGLFEKATGKPPYALPDRLMMAKEKMNGKALLNFASTCDIVGGNSGSPVFDKDANVVGVVFDGNFQSLGGNFWFDEEVNRAVAVSTEAMVEALRGAYGADALVREMLKQGSRK
jgi:hypothetical protein